MLNPAAQPRLLSAATLPQVSRQGNETQHNDVVRKALETQNITVHAEIGYYADKNHGSTGASRIIANKAAQ